MNTSSKPFYCNYSPQFAELLNKLDISLVVSTYQVNKIIILKSVETDKITQLLRNFRNAMGIAVKGNKLAVSTLNEVVLLKNRPEIAGTYPSKPDVYDSIFIPSARFLTGHLSLHDMEFIKDKLVAVNTNFSCLAYIDAEHSFTPFWQPPFISELALEDRCHLNGLAVENDEIKYLTALGKSDTPHGWRPGKMNSGILMEYPSGRIILDKLAMPHSPRLFNGKLYLLNSAQGELLSVNPKDGTSEVIVKLGAFARGMSLHGDYLFIGVSKLRHNNPTFADLPIAKTSFSGIIAVYLPNKSIVGSLNYEMSVDEIYDVKVIDNYQSPSILSPDMEVVSRAITTPKGSLWSKPVNKDEQSQYNKQNNQELIQSLKNPEINFQVINNVEPKNLSNKFPGLLFPIFLKIIEKKPISGKLITIVALHSEKPVALIVTELKPDNTAELYSLVVLKEFQKRGIASELLEINENLLSSNEVKYIDVRWAEAYQHAKVFEKLINGAQWLPKQETILNYKVKINSKTAAKIQQLNKTNDENTKFVDWKDITAEDKQQINKIINRKGFPPYLTPFQMPETIDLDISQAIRINGEVVGWGTIHKISADTVQSFSSYVKDEYRKNGLALKLYIRLGEKLLDKNIDFCIFQIPYNDKTYSKYIRYIDILLSDFIVRRYKSFISRKNLTQVNID